MSPVISSPSSSSPSSSLYSDGPPNFARLSGPNRRVAQYIYEQAHDQRRAMEAEKVSRTLIEAFEQIGAKRGAGGLETSRWATKSSGVGESHSRKNIGSTSTSQPNSRSTSPSSSSSNSDSHTNISGQRPAANKKVAATQSPKLATKAAPRPVDSKMTAQQKWTALVDDTDAFMNAIASLPALGTKAPAATSTAETVRLPTNDTTEAPAHTPVDIQGDTTFDTHEVGTPVDATADTTVDAPKAHAIEESREQQLTFSSWGTPAARTGPAAEIRRIVLTNVPSFLLAPTKILSLMHGGAIETVSVNTSKQTADVLFCDAAACKDFYDKYPNGIDVDLNSRRGTVFVEMGKEVDVLSSRLRESLGIGATRVLRAIGVPLDCTLEDMIRMTDKHFKLEKILDSYEAGLGVRTVTFRFCTIDNAVRFRSVLVRDESWEQANVQYGPDPCEIATGIHWD